MIARRAVLTGTVLLGASLSCGPLAADVIISGPPLDKVRLSSSERRKRMNGARAAVLKVHDFSLPSRPEWLNIAYRSANAKGVNEIKRIVDIQLIGWRAFVLTEAASYARAPQMRIEEYAYFQCVFDANDMVVAVEAL